MEGVQAEAQTSCRSLVQRVVAMRREYSGKNRKMKYLNRKRTRQIPSLSARRSQHIHCFPILLGVLPSLFLLPAPPDILLHHSMYSPASSAMA